MPPLPFELDHDSYHRESALAGMGFDIARAWAMPEEEGNNLTATYADFYEGLDEQDRELVWYWYDLFHPVAWPRDPLSVWLRETRT